MKTSMTGRLILPQQMRGSLYFIGRQPIFDRSLEVFAYELLFRSSQENTANVTDGDQATLTVLVDTFTKAGLNTLVGSKKAFINLTRNFLTGQYPISISPNRVVLEILEDTELDENLVEALKVLTSTGYQFAVDDVISLDHWPVSLSDVVSYAKVDIATVSVNELPLIVAELKKESVLLIAEKVETRESYQLCRQLGFDFFQGFFFCRPEIVSGRKFETSRMVVMQALASLQNPNMRLKDLEKTISMDATLGYSLLKLVNSGYYSLPVTITSIRHAISMIGTQQLRNWLSLFLISRVGDKPHELCNQGLLRAKAAESFAEGLNLTNPESYFLVGLFSILEALLDMPVNEIVTGLNLSSEIASALLEGKGPMGKILKCVEGIETGNWDSVGELGLGIEKVSAIYMDAIRWTELLQKDLLPGSNMDQ